MANGPWKIARRGNGQLPLVIVLALAVVLILLGKANSGLFDRIRVDITDAMAPVLATVRSPLDETMRWFGSAGDIFRVHAENQRLREENARLRQWRNASVVLEGRVKHYEALLRAVPDPAMNVRLARVIGRASRPFLRTMILGAGREHGVHPGQAVRDERGMIGRIYLSGQRTAWVILLTDINSRIPVTIAPGAIPAILAGDNTAMPRLELGLSNVSVKAGDQVVSSGDGGLVPPGLPIGTVVQDSDGFHVALLADAARSEDVEVLNFSRPAEELPPNTLPVEAAGLKPLPPKPATGVPPLPVTGVPPLPVTGRAAPPRPVVQPVTPAAAAGDGGE